MIDGYSIAMWFASRLLVYLIAAAVAGGLFVGLAFVIVWWVSK
jgi:hypothetical protein